MQRQRRVALVAIAFTSVGVVAAGCGDDGPEPSSGTSPVTTVDDMSEDTMVDDMSEDSMVDDMSEDSMTEDSMAEDG